MNMLIKYVYRFQIQYHILIKVKLYIQVTLEVRKLYQLSQQIKKTMDYKMIKSL